MRHLLDSVCSAHSLVSLGLSRSMNASGVLCTMSVLALLFRRGHCFINEKFDTGISPCDNLFAHVCNYESEGFPDRHKAFLFNEAYEKAIEHFVDPIYNMIAEEVNKGAAKNIDECYKQDARTTFYPSKGSKEGRALGVLIVSGKVKDVELSCIKDVECSVRFTDFHRAVTETQFANAPDFIQGIFEGYLEHADVRTGNENMMKKDFKVRYPRLQDESQLQITLIEDLHNFKELDRTSKFRRPLHEVLFYSNRFAPYFNLVYSRILKESDVLPSENNLEDLRMLFGLVKKEAIELVNNSWSTDEISRKDIIDHLENLPHVFGLPNDLLNAETLKPRIDEYQRIFLSKKVTAYLETLKVCKFEALARLIAQIFNKSMFENTTRTLPISEKNYGESVFQFNAFYHSSSGLHFLPAFIHIIKQEMSLGMKYGIMASAMGHELFHGLGLVDSSQPHLFRVQSNPHFRDAVECYHDYYTSFSAKINGKTKYPSGKRKAEEGMPDVEGARLAFRVLKKTLKEHVPGRKRAADHVYYPLFNAVPSDSLMSSHLEDPHTLSLTDEQWFHVAYALVHCSNKDDAKLFREYEHTDYPRPTVRANAMASQLKSFTDSFHCTNNHRLYWTERHCELYPRIEEGIPKPEIGRWRKGSKENSKYYQAASSNSRRSSAFVYLLPSISYIVCWWFQ
uniref:Peptidase_M13 domain-containing protein n=1 Tax=Steinernema glaseri TaxID=37863 RepID=A0A1I7ZCA4_9BILA